MNDTHTEDEGTVIPGTSTQGAFSDVPLDSLPVYLLAQSLTKFVSPVIIICGVFGNIMTITIMRKKTAGDATVNMFFISIAVGDLVVLLTGTTKHWFEALLNTEVGQAGLAVKYLLIWIPSSTGAIVNWMLVCVTMQRAMSVVWPHRVNLLCTRRRVLVVIVGISAFLALLYSHYLYNIYDQSLNAGSGPQGDTPASVSPYVWFLDNVFSYIDLSLFSLVPFACLALANTVLVWSLATSMKQASQQMVLANSQQDLHRKKVISSVTLTVIVVSFTFIVLTLPTCIFLVLFYFKDMTAMSSQSQADIFLFSKVSFLLVDTNSAINFFIYCLTGRKFRKEFMKMMGCERKGKKSSSHDG